jgi:hypothetical protein
MAEPPPNIDPELLIIGEGSCDNFRTWVPTLNEREFRIDPRPVPIWSIVIHNVVIVAVCCVLQWAFQTFKLGANQLPYCAIPAFGLLLCVVYTLIAVHSFRCAILGGPWFIYDAQSGQITLPREGETFARQDVVHLQYITTKIGAEEARSELNLITLRGGRRERWPLLRSNRAFRPFDSVLHPLVFQTGLPVVRIRDGYKPSEVKQERWMCDTKKAPGH